MSKFTSNYISPGQALRSLIDDKDWTQEDLARILTISLKHTNELIKDKKSVSLDIAMSLEKVFGYKAMDWVILDLKFQISKKEQEDEENDLVKKSAYFYEYMPINELIKKGWLKSYASTKDLVKQIRKFWDIPKQEAVDLSFLDDKSVQLEFKTSVAYESRFKKFNALTWHQRALNFGEKLDVGDFDMNGLRLLMDKMHQYTFMKNGISKFLNELNKVGVKFCFLSHLSKTYLDGAAFVSNNNPMIALTGRYNRVDNFWFTLAHEASHIIAHLNLNDRAIFIDDTSSSKSKTSKKEREANQMASNYLLIDEILDYFESDFGYLTEEKVISFSESKEIHPSIVVGMLAFNNKTSYSNLHRYKETVKDKIPKKFIAG